MISTNLTPQICRFDATRAGLNDDLPAILEAAGLNRYQSMM
jgi:hypothetical protein